MSASNLVDPLTNKIYEQYIPQGGGIALTKGQLITADGAGTEVAFPTVAPANGTILSYDSTELFGLKYIAVPGATPLDYQELLSANPANQSTIVPAPAQNGYVLTSDNTLGVASAGMQWKPATGGGGILQTKAPLFEDNTTSPHTIGINFSASVGEIPYGNGTAQEGALSGASNPASSNQFLGTVAGVPTWKTLGGQTTALPPLVEIVGAGDESQIGIGFGTGQVGQIPYGNGTINQGTLTNTPSAGQILGINAGVPAWIPAGGSGTVTANLPLVEGASGNSSLVSINFSAGVYGEIPYGTGANALVGALLAPPTDPVAIGKVLTYAGTPSILEWRTPATPVGGDVITLHSSVATTQVPKPTDKDEQLIIVAEEISASWDLQTSTLPPPFDKAFQPELRFANSAGQQFIAIEQLGGGTPPRREVALYTLGLSPNYLITTFVFQSATTPVDNNAFIACTCNGIDPYGVNHFAGTQYDGTVIIGGKFTSINVGGSYEFIYNIALLSLQSGVWKVAYVGGSPLGDPGADGWQGVVNNNDPDDPDVGVFSITPFPANSLTGLAGGGGGAVGFLSAGFLVGGKITDVLGEGSGFLNQTGYFNLIPFFCNTASPLASAQVQDEGLIIGATPPQPKADGAVCGCLFDATYQYMWLTGNGFEVVKDNGSSSTQLVPNACQGFVLFYPVGLNPGDSAWGQLGAIAPTSFGTQFQYDIKPSTTLANHIVCMGDQMFLKDITVPTAGVASYTQIGTPSVPVAVGFPLLVQGYFNSIVRNVTVTTPTGAVTGDFFVYFKGGGGDGTQYVGYMTTATGTTVNPLAPIPCGPNSVSLGTVRSSYGINNLITPTVLTIGGDLGEYNYDAQTHTNIDFDCIAGVTFKIPAGTPNITQARFGSPYQSQSYIASSDLASWIHIGATNANITYS
jgi:hypothetical protein